MNKKATGSYYTPLYLAKFIVNRVIENLMNKSDLSILEPSVGDGAFIEVLNSSNVNYRLTAVDINNFELKKASDKNTSKYATFVNKDYLTYNAKKKFSLIIGNPPYVKKIRLSENQVSIAQEILFNEGLSKKNFKNLWVVFLVKSITLLKDDGILAFVLPSDLLQIKYANEIKSYLKKQFELLEIFTFNNLMFDCRQQDTVVLFAYKQADKKGVYYSNIKKVKQLDSGKYSLKKNQALVNTNIKWIHHCLTTSELNFLNKLQKPLEKISYYCDSKPGIVTGANSFFIVNEDTVKQYNLEKFVKPIIQKGLFVNGSVVFDESDYKDLDDSGKPAKLLNFKENDRLNRSIRQYLKIGVEQKLPERYKCRIRKKWFVVPNVSNQSEGFFFKRSHLYPKLLKNQANVFVTDAAYKVDMKSNYNIDSLIYSFYNSLTLIFSELQGRYYGGGVLELTPSEFKSLPIPYCELSESSFKRFCKIFKNKECIEDILDKNDFKILSSKLLLTKEDILKIQRIRKKLIAKRLRI